MKKLLIIIIGIFVASIAAQSQTKYNLGAGYYGETLTYPGIVLNGERETYLSDKFSTPIIAAVGFYNHQRSHSAIFVDLMMGSRRYFDNSLFVEHYLGLGVMFSHYSDEVWTVTEEGDPRIVTSWAMPDFSPSVSLGLGYNFSDDPQLKRNIWVRPKLNWQLPFNGLANPHIALQVGFSYTLKTK